MRFFLWQPLPRFWRWHALSVVAALAFTSCAPDPLPVPRPTPLPILVPTTAPTPVAPTATALPEGGDMVARVNGEPLSRALWARQVARAQRSLQAEEGIDPASADGRARLDEVARLILEELIDEQLIRQAARELGVTVSPTQLEEIMAREIELLGGPVAFEGWLAENDLAPDEYRGATELQLLSSALRERVTSDLAVTQPQVHPRHLLVATRAEAEALLTELENGADFVTLTRERSIDPGTRDTGGDLGWLPRGILPEPLDRELWQLGPGERSGVIESGWGFHLVEVIEQDPARPLALELLQALQQQGWERWLDAQRANAKIERWQIP